MNKVLRFLSSEIAAIRGKDSMLCLGVKGLGKPCELFTSPNIPMGQGQEASQERAGRPAGA